MSCLKRILNFKNLLLFVSAILLSGCGVKGDPLPPEKPTPLGRGRPTYKRATEGIKLQKTKKTTETEQDYSDEEQDQDEQE